MKDERLEAGRHHLARGEEALGCRDHEAARAHFESAVLQFAGPDLKMGEGQALRGLAKLAAAQGEGARAEALYNSAAACFRTVRTLLDALDDRGVAAGYRASALEAEANVQVELGELLLRSGRLEEAQRARDWARAAFDGVGGRPSEAALWVLTARIAAQRGALDEAQTAWEQVLAIQLREHDRRGQAGALLALAEIARLGGALDEAEERQRRGLAIARALGDRALEARALAGLGLIALQRNDDDDAAASYRAALHLAEQLDDRELRGFCELHLGAIASRSRAGDAVGHFRRAITLLGAAGAEHAMAATMLHAAEHALRTGNHDLALLLAEGARRIWRVLDPVRGVGRALRVAVQALAADQLPIGDLLLLASYREDCAGAVQPHAVRVADHYRGLAGGEALAAVDTMDAEERRMAAEELLAERVEARLGPTSLRLSDLGTERGALVLLDRLAAAPDHRELTEIAVEDLEPLPDEDAFYVLCESDLILPRPDHA